MTSGNMNYANFSRNEKLRIREKMKKKIIEVFCGNKSLSKIAEKRNYDILTLDFNPKFKPDLCINALDFNKRFCPKEFRNPFFMWFSPPCESFSLSGNSYFLGFPTNSKAYIGLALAYKCLELIREFKPKYWLIENPRAGLRSQWFMKPLEKTTVSYCQYGFNYMKPTDLFNNFGFKGKICKNGDSCHESAPRGSKKGVQGEKSSEKRGIIPPLLINEILNQLENFVNTN